MPVNYQRGSAALLEIWQTTIFAERNSKGKPDAK
jgi:hypothetical protein